MEVIRNASGAVIHKSKNLAGIRRFVSKNLIKVIDLTAHSTGGAKLMILFENGCSFETEFADSGFLGVMVLQWRNVYGAPLSINGHPSDLVEKDNISLIQFSKGISHL